MNLLTRWTKRGLAQIAASKLDKEILENKRHERIGATIKSKFSNLSKELWNKKFTMVEWITYVRKTETGRAYATTPNGRLIEITMNEDGGIVIRDLNTL